MDKIKQILAGLLAVAMMATPLAAETTRSISEKASQVAYIRTADVGVGASAELVDLSGLTGFGTKSFSIAITNENNAKDLIVDFIGPGESLAASELTTPADATLSEVIRIEEKTTLSIDCQCAGWVWQSEGDTAVDAHAVITW